VIVDLPPEVERVVDSAPAQFNSHSPVLDVGLWEWKITPDYKEPSKHDIDVTSSLAYSTPRDLFALWFSDAPVSRYLACGETRVGVSASDEPVNIVVTRPTSRKAKPIVGLPIVGPFIRHQPAIVEGRAEA
jgi:hypothetical protein